MSEPKIYHGSDPFVIAGKPVDLEYNKKDFDEFSPPQGQNEEDQQDAQATGFFITAENNQPEDPQSAHKPQS